MPKIAVTLYGHPRKHHVISLEYSSKVGPNPVTDVYRLAIDLFAQRSLHVHGDLQRVAITYTNEQGEEMTSSIKLSDLHAQDMPLSEWLAREAGRLLPPKPYLSKYSIRLREGAYWAPRMSGNVTSTLTFAERYESAAAAEAALGEVREQFPEDEPVVMELGRRAREVNDRCP